jgi:hypothetical protein
MRLVEKSRDTFKTATVDPTAKTCGRPTAECLALRFLSRDRVSLKQNHKFKGQINFSNSI